MSRIFRKVLCLSLLTSLGCTSKHWGEQAARENARPLGPNENRDPAQPRDASSVERYQSAYTVELNDANPGELVQAGEVLAPFDDGFRISRPHETRAGTWVEVGRGASSTGTPVKVRRVEAGTLPVGATLYFCPLEGAAAATYRSCLWREGRVEKVDTVFGRVQVPGRSLLLEAPVLVPEAP